MHLASADKNAATATSTAAGVHRGSASFPILSIGTNCATSMYNKITTNNHQDASASPTAARS